MFVGVKRERSADCASDLRIDRWLAGELDAYEGECLRKHVARCSRCRERQALLSELRQRFESSPLAAPSWLDVARVQRTPRAGRFHILALASLVAAVGGVLALVTLPAPPTSVRTKGKPFVSYFVKRGEQVERGSTREPLHPADQLRFAYTSASAQYLAILSLDGAAHASVYYPTHGPAVRVEPGSEVLLPSAVELDDTIGDELIVALFCDRPFEVSQLRAALASERAPPPAPTGCTTHELRVTKRPAAP